MCRVQVIGHFFPLISIVTIATNEEDILSTKLLCLLSQFNLILKQLSEINKLDRALKV